MFCIIITLGTLPPLTSTSLWRERSEPQPTVSTVYKRHCISLQRHDGLEDWHR